MNDLLYLSCPKHFSLSSSWPNPCGSPSESTHKESFPSIVIIARNTGSSEGLVKGSWLRISLCSIISPLQLESSPPTFGIDRSLRPDRESTTRFTEYCTSGDIIGELSCLLKREIEYTVICETILQVSTWFCLYCGCYFFLKLVRSASTFFGVWEGSIILVNPTSYCEAG